MGEADFVPLADVPDFYWKHGKQGASRGSEGPNHFADMDQPGPGGQTLLDMSAQPEGIDPDRWNQFYDQVTDLLTGDPVAAEHRGLLPFRVWQIFDAMVTFVTTATANASFAPRACLPTISATPASRCTSRICMTAIQSSQRPARFTIATARPVR